MTRILRAAAMALGVATLSCAGNAERAAPATHTVRLAKTVANDLRLALARMPDVTVEIAAEGGSSITSLVDLYHAKIDISEPLADVAYLAYAGQLEGLAQPFDQLRGIAVIGLNTIHFVIGPGVRASSLRDVKGLSISLGAPGSSIGLISPRLLEAHRVHANDIRGAHLPNAELVSRLAAGKIDAAFSAFSVPSTQVTAAMKAGGRMLEITGPEVERMRLQYPYLKRTLIPAGTYPNQPNPVRTVGVDIALVCRADLDDDLVYRLLDAYFATLPAMTPPNLERAPATPIPLHSGAARYYRQRELTR